MGNGEPPHVWHTADTNGRPPVRPEANFLLPSGQLNIVDWAAELVSRNPQAQHLRVYMGPRPTRMAHSQATGRGLLSNGALGVDVIRLYAGSAFVPHTHPGDHLLIVVGGQGTITYRGVIYPTHAGQVYMVEGRVPHAVGAITDHVILAVGSPHVPVDSPERMAPVEYQDVLTPIHGQLTCRICDVSTAGRRPIHEQGCQHCPCPECVNTGDEQTDKRLRETWAMHDALMFHGEPLPKGHT
jgi:quercetin dioxygenase-like cupin family protein